MSAALHIARPSPKHLFVPPKHKGIQNKSFTVIRNKLSFYLTLYLRPDEAFRKKMYAFIFIILFFLFLYEGHLSPLDWPLNSNIKAHVSILPEKFLIEEISKVF